MPEYFRPLLKDLECYRNGPLTPHMDDFAALLVERHYSNPTGWRKLRLVSDLSQWLAKRRLKITELDEQAIKAFLQARWRKRRHQSGERSTLALLVHQLRAKTFIPAPEPPPIRSWQDLIIQDYEQFLLRERGLMPASADHYLRTVRRFLSERFPTGKGHLKQLRPQDITDFVLHASSCRGRPSLRGTTSALRSFLGFAFQMERTTTNLAVAVPKVAVWSSSPLPRYLEAPQVERVLRCCDRRRKAGKRDYAILLLLARLGLRANEVVHLSLEDIDWGAGELRIYGKGPRVDRLPLVQDVGEALADYLQKGRPGGACRRVFLQSNAPYGAIGSSHTISAVVQRALARAELHPPRQGAHLLRHSLATRMMRGGASLAQIGQVLRHQHSRTTEIYAKVDLAALRALAQPWPGGTQ